MTPAPPRFTLFPYTTLFRSGDAGACASHGQTARQGRKPDIVGRSLRRSRAGHGRSLDLGRSLDRARCGEEIRSEEHTSELQSRFDLVCRLLLEKKKAMSNW